MPTPWAPATSMSMRSPTKSASRGVDPEPAERQLEDQRLGLAPAHLVGDQDRLEQVGDALALSTPSAVGV